jgi:hypothetical protein
MKKKEEELDKHGGLDRAIAAKKMGAHGRRTLRMAIQRSIEESDKEFKKTKTQVLRAIGTDDRRHRLPAAGHPGRSASSPAPSSPTRSRPGARSTS